MKITEIKTHPMKVVLQQPSWTAHEIGQDSTLTLFEVQTDQGITVYGEVQGGPQGQSAKSPLFLVNVSKIWTP